jgi:aspartate aminotransferase
VFPRLCPGPRAPDPLLPSPPLPSPLLSTRSYRYLDPATPTTPSLDFAGLKEDLLSAPEGALVLLQACAHNPTGVDPSPEQWREIAAVCEERKLVPLLDNAYQGFASGCVETDAFAVRLFAERKIPCFVACSFAKNMGLYGERVGVLHVVAEDGEARDNAVSQLKIVARTTYSNPPSFGGRIVEGVLGDAGRREQWEEDLRGMAGRIVQMRERLRDGLERETGSSWKHITDQIGMFSYTGLTKEQVKACEEKGVFMLASGRVSMAGLNDANVDATAKVMADAIKGSSV